jgi:predicted acylesterase/phospholipase RssA
MAEVRQGPKQLHVHRVGRAQKQVHVEKVEKGPKQSHAQKVQRVQKPLQERQVKQESKLHREMAAAQEEEVEFLVFSGGGAKGAIYSGVVEALAESGTLDGVKAVAGSSAGAITAAFVASGISSEEFKKLSKDTNFKGLLGEGLLPGNIVPIGQDGKPLYELLDKTIKQNIWNFIGNADTSKLSELGRQNLDRLVIEKEKNNKQTQILLDEQEVNSEEIKQLTAQSEAEPDLAARNRIIDKIVLIETQQKVIEKDIKGLTYQREDFESQTSKIQSMIDNQWAEVESLKARCDPNNNNGKVSFKDLALMRLLDPVKFKDLLVTAVRRDTGELEIFSATTTPDVEIALACRASASIPVVFKPVTINGHEYVDGGYIDNVPTKYFEDQKQGRDIEDITTEGSEKTAAAKKQGRTLAFAFGGGAVDNELNVALYSAEKFYEPNAIVKFLKDVLFKFIAKVGGTFKYTETEKATLNNLRENALNVVPLDTKNVGTLSFDAAQENNEYLTIKGYTETKGHLQNHAIGNSADDTHIHKKFLLNVYERLEEKPSAVQPWSAKINVSREDKNKELLSFVTTKKWDERMPQTILEEYVILAATKRGVSANDRLSNDTNTMVQLVEQLNASDTPIKIKKEFIQLLDIDIKTTPKYDPGKNHEVNVAKFEFKKEHFNNLLDRSKPHPSLQVAR